LDSAIPPTIQEPVTSSTALRSDEKASCARFTIPMDTPKVSRSEESSGALTTRKTSVRWSRTPTANSTAIDRGSER
jgi:hypothetical protein